MADLVIYGMKGSPFVRKVQVVLAEKGVPFDFEMASPFPPPDWFIEMNPAKRIPVLKIWRRIPCYPNPHRDSGGNLPSGAGRGCRG